jgi:heme A synthase
LVLLTPQLESNMTSSQTYLLGFIILVLGIGFAAYMLGVPMLWIALGAVVLIGLGIMASARRTRSGQV